MELGDDLRENGRICYATQRLAGRIDQWINHQEIMQSEGNLPNCDASIATFLQVSTCNQVKSTLLIK